MAHRYSQYTHTLAHTCAHYTDIWPADKTVNQHKQQQQQQLPIVNPNVLPSELRASWEGIADFNHVAGEEAEAMARLRSALPTDLLRIDWRVNYTLPHAIRCELRTESNRIEAELTPLAFHSAVDMYLQDTAHVLATWVYINMYICRIFQTENRNCL